ALRLTFTSTNNEAEYEALLAGLRIARKMNVQDLKVKVDYKLVASQINESYVASSNNMIKYLFKAKEYIAFFKSFSIKNNARNLNQKADIHRNKRNQRRGGRRRRPLDDSNRSMPVEGDLAEILSKLTSVAFNHLTKEILVKVLNKISTETKEINAVVEEEGDNWMTPIF
ncbi:reverse transcriptase domain-containing protein, partial [Tanacetum coccineum]